MNWHLNFQPGRMPEQLNHQHKVLMIGSCFTENIAEKLSGLKFDIMQNPNGILYDPLSISESLVSYVDHKVYESKDLFHLDELWHNWQHHGIYSGPDKEAVLNRINNSQSQAHTFLKNSDWVFITLGSAFSYALAENGRSVANCHKAPSRTFNKRLLTIEEIKSTLDTCVHRLFHFNPRVKIIFTVSPVRYLRDGLVENNLSKARLIEVVQHLVNKFSRLYYFPAYELVIDVLRDYRFFKDDMVHPTQQAVDYVFEAFKITCFDEPTIQATAEVEKIISALNHRPLHPDSTAFLKFKTTLISQMEAMQKKYPYLNFEKEMARLKAGGGFSSSQE